MGNTQVAGESDEELVEESVTTIRKTCKKCERPTHIGDFCSVIHALEYNPQTFFDLECRLNNVVIGEKVHVSIKIDDQTIKSICRNKMHLISIDIKFKDEYHFMTDWTLTYSHTIPKSQVTKALRALKNKSDSSDESDESDESMESSNSYYFEYPELYKLPPLFDGAPEISLSSEHMMEFFDLLNSRKIKLPEDYCVNDYVQLLNKATETKNYALCLIESDGEWLFRTNELLLCHLLMPGGTKSIRICEAALTAFFINNYAYLNMTMIDIQPYVVKKLAPLGRTNLSRTTNLDWHNDVNIIIPHSNDDNVMSMFVDRYTAKQTNAYYNNYLNDDKHVSIVAVDSQKNLLGYVTCSLQKGIGPTYFPDTPMLSPDLKKLAVVYGEQKPFKLFSIDGLHVSTEKRGGQENSLAMLLLFHALYFVQESANELGIRLVASNSYARTTMINLTQLGFHHLNYEQALEWMKERE
jgi:hypothetical protein